MDTSQEGLNENQGEMIRTKYSLILSMTNVILWIRKHIMVITLCLQMAKKKTSKMDIR
jgi:hypothetical protein